MINYKTPQKYLLLAIPIAILLGIVIGLLFNTTFLKPTVTIAAIIMIYAMMIGINFKELTQIKNSKVIYLATLYNFTIVPIIAYAIGKIILIEHDMMFAGLLLIASFPTSGMTISWTAMQKGNVSSAIKLTISSLLIGTIFAPFYLSKIIGESIDINIISIISKIALVVLVPILLGHVTYKILLRRYTIAQFKEQIKPNLSSLSVWSMLYLVFVSISMKANALITDPIHLIYSFITIIVFYVLIYTITVTIAKFVFKRENAIVFINSIVLRNLSIALGIAFTTFGPQAALIITIGYMVQQQSFALYVKILETLKERERNIQNASRKN